MFVLFGIVRFASSLLSFDTIVDLIKMYKSFCTISIMSPDRMEKKGRRVIAAEGQLEQFEEFGTRV